MKSIFVVSRCRQGVVGARNCNSGMPVATHRVRAGILISSYLLAGDASANINGGIVTVVVQGTTTGTVSDYDGRYTLALKARQNYE